MSGKPQQSRMGCHSEFHMTIGAIFQEPTVCQGRSWAYDLYHLMQLLVQIYELCTLFQFTVKKQRPREAKKTAQNHSAIGVGPGFELKSYCLMSTEFQGGGDFLKSP